MKAIPGFFSIFVVLLVGLVPHTLNSPSVSGNSSHDTISTSLLHYQQDEQKIAVTEAGYDDIGSILDSMDLEYTQIKVEDLPDYEVIKPFDVIFINCPGMLYDEYAYPEGATENLERFVREGGKLYVSDWAIYYIELAFPDYLDHDPDPADPYGGIGQEKQTVTANILDPGLQQELQSQTVDIYFDLVSWIVLKRTADSVHVFLSGDVETLDGQTLTDVPLSVSFPYEKGYVLYTSYHNEPGSVEVTEEQKKLLQYLVQATTEPVVIPPKGGSESSPTAKPDSGLTVARLALIIGGFLCIASLIVAVGIGVFFMMKKRRA